METPPLWMLQRENEEAIECWDDDDDLQLNDDIQFRTASTATSVTGFSVRRSGHRDSVSSRRSCKSDLDSNIGDDESWQLLLQENDEFSTQDAITSAKNAGIPIPDDIPKSALLGGTIKRLGGKKARTTPGDDWSEDLVFSGIGGELELKLYRETASPDSLLHLSSLTSSPVKKRDSLDFGFDFLDSSPPPPPKPVVDSLEKFRDTDDDLSFADVPTIKASKLRQISNPFVSAPPEPSAKDVPTIKASKLRQISNPFVSAPPEPSAKDDGFDKDFVFPTDAEPLRLAARTDALKTPDPFSDEFDPEWAEGSIGVRFGGTRRDERSNRSSTISMMSPSLSSCLTAESEEDALEGLILPDASLDLAGSLQKRLQAMQNKDKEPPPEPTKPSTTKQSDPVKTDDFFSGLEIGDSGFFDPAKLTLNRNIQFKSERPSSPRRPSTAITFTSKSTRIPRLSGHERLERPHSSHLEPVSESGDPMSKFDRPASRLTGHATHSSLSCIPVPLNSHAVSSFSTRRTLRKITSRDGLHNEAGATSPQPLSNKRTTPAMRSVNHSSAASLQKSPPRRETPFRPTFSTRPKTPVNRSTVTDGRNSAGRRPQVPFVPTGASPNQSHHMSVKPLNKRYRRTDSESSGEFQSCRPISRHSNPNIQSPGSHAATMKHSVTKPTRRRHFGDGTELDIFDDLPTSTTVESNFTKVPIRRGAPRSVKNRLSQSNIISPQSQRIETPAPTVPHTSPPQQDSTPRFARDTNASRNARQQRLASLSFSHRDRDPAPLTPLNSNWRNQSIPRPPISPTITKTRPRKRTTSSGGKPQLIKPMGTGVHEPKCKFDKVSLLRSSSQHAYYSESI